MKGSILDLCLWRYIQKEETLGESTTIAMVISEPQPDHSIDIVSETCPMTFVLVRLALDQMEPGQILEVRLCGAEARRNIPLTAQEQGHELLGVSDFENGYSVLLLRRG